MDRDTERSAILHEDRIGDLEPDEAVYADLVLTACQAAMRGPYDPIELLAGIVRYDGELLDTIGLALMAAPIPEQTRRATLYGALKMAPAYIYANTPPDDD